jgi:hypothetical protein
VDRTGPDTDHVTTSSANELGDPSNRRAAECAALIARIAHDRDLAQVVASWSKLPEAIRQRIAGMVEAIGLAR